MTSCLSGERARRNGLPLRMSPREAGGSRSGAPSVGRGLVATETLMLLPGLRTPASERRVERDLWGDIGDEAGELVEVDRLPPPAGQPQRRVEGEPPSRREQVGVVEVDVDHGGVERRPDDGPGRRAERVRR